MSFATEIYRSTDQYGNTVFSDKAPQNSTPVKLPPINTTPATETREPAHRQKTQPTVTMSNQIAIQSPSNGDIIPNGRIPTSVRVTTREKVDPSQRIVIELDGQTVANSRSCPYTIPRLSRGPQRIRASHDDQSGKVNSKASVDIMVYQPGN
jgi:hypothetical protein